MSRSVSNILATSKPWLGRALWGCMALCHAPAFVGIWSALAAGESGTGALAQLVGLSASMLFFALKFCDLPCLRVRTEWRAYLAFALVVAIIHLGVIAPDATGTMWLECGPLVSLTLLSGVLLWGAKGWRALWSRIEGAGQSTLTLSRSHWAAWLDCSRVQCLVLLYRTSIPRSPPA